MLNSKIFLPWFIAPNDGPHRMNILVRGDGCECSRVEINKIKSFDSFLYLLFICAS